MHHVTANRKLYNRTVIIGCIYAAAHSTYYINNTYRHSSIIVLTAVVDAREGYLDYSIAIDIIELPIAISDLTSIMNA